MSSTSIPAMLSSHASPRRSSLHAPVSHASFHQARASSMSWLRGVPVAGSRKLTRKRSDDRDAVRYDLIASRTLSGRLARLLRSSPRSRLIYALVIVLGVLAFAASLSGISTSSGDGQARPLLNVEFSKYLPDSAYYRAPLPFPKRRRVPDAVNDLPKHQAGEKPAYVGDEVVKKPPPKIPEKQPLPVKHPLPVPVAAVKAKPNQAAELPAKAPVAPPKRPAVLFKQPPAMPPPLAGGDNIFEQNLALKQRQRQAALAAEAAQKEAVHEQDGTQNEAQQEATAQTQEALEVAPAAPPVQTPVRPPEEDDDDELGMGFLAAKEGGRRQINMEFTPVEDLTEEELAHIRALQSGEKLPEYDFPGKLPSIKELMAKQAAEADDPDTALSYDDEQP